jgi:hypothetical protein
LYTGWRGIAREKGTIRTFRTVFRGETGKWAEFALRPAAESDFLSQTAQVGLVLPC